MLTQASSGMINANVVIAIINMAKQERVNAMQPVFTDPACAEDRGELVFMRPEFPLDRYLHPHFHQHFHPYNLLHLHRHELPLWHLSVHSVLRWGWMVFLPNMTIFLMLSANGALSLWEIFPILMGI